MSILLGKLKERDIPATEVELCRLSRATEHYATGSSAFYTSGRLGMAFQPYLSHERSVMEGGSCVDIHGNALSFDGRLDNYRELAAELGVDASNTSDSRIVLIAFHRWGEDCFRRLTGDWALVLWAPRHELLYLARDHAGARTLYFRIDGHAVEWGTYLDTFLAENTGLAISKSYIACYLSGIQLRNLTPYDSIMSVPPAHYVIVGRGEVRTRAHWSAAQIAEVTCKSDKDYEDSFLALLKQSVRRRANATESVLAELSGGIDSTAIVCVSDSLRRSEQAGAALVDTVSYCDDAEQSLDDKRYFLIAETERGKVGTHLDMAISQRTFLPHSSAKGRYLVPGADSLSMTREEQFLQAVWSRGYRSLLSGIGGDELLGGVPDPKPELTDYLASGNMCRFLRQCFAWSLLDRSPLVETLACSVAHAANLYRTSLSSQTVPSWLTPTLTGYAQEKAHGDALRQRWRYTPRQLSNEDTWWAVMETLPHLFPRIVARPEYRYPYLDKDLVNFLMAIPREELLRPNRRRSLMRRALAGIVPHEVLERKAKAFQLRGVLLALQRARPSLEELFQRSRLMEEGCIDSDLFRSAFRRACEGEASHTRTLIRTIAMELWLQSEKTALGSRTMPFTLGSAA
jgi:asparagine synthase (glutamine-hydrolysing)